MQDGSHPVHPVVPEQVVTTQRSSSQQVPPAWLPGQRILEHWSRPLKLLPLHVELLLLLPDLPRHLCLVFTEEYLGSAEWTGAVHRVLLAESAETRFTEDVTTGVDLEWFMKQVQTHRTYQIITNLSQLWLTLQQLLNKSQV